MKLKYVGDGVARIRVPSVGDPKVDVQPGETIEVDETMGELLLHGHDFAGGFVPTVEVEEPKKRKAGRSTQELKHYSKG